MKIEDEKNRDWKRGKRMTLNGKPVRIGDPTLVSAPWMKSEEGGINAPFAQDEQSRSSFSLAIFASAPASPKIPPPRTKSKSGARSFNSRESHGSIFAYPRHSHMQIHDQGSKDSLSSLPSPPPVYGGRSNQSRGDMSPRFISLPPSTRHSTDTPSPTTPRFIISQTRQSAERELPEVPSTPQSPRDYYPPPPISEATPHYSMNYGPTPLTTRPSSLAPSVAPSITTTVFNRKSTATQASADARKSRGGVSLYYDDEDYDAASVYTTIDRMASFRSMPRISTGPDFSADWSELGIDIPPVPDLPSRSNTIKSSRAPSLHQSQHPMPPLPQIQAGENFTSSSLNPFQDPPQDNGLASVDDTTISHENYSTNDSDSKTSTRKNA